MKSIQSLIFLSLAAIFIPGMHEAADQTGSSIEHYLPIGLVMKASPLPLLNAPNDHDFHIAMHEEQTAIIWTQAGSQMCGEYLCGAICPIGSDCSSSQEEQRFQEILNSDSKIITKWIASSDQEDVDILSPVTCNHIDWKHVSNLESDQKWIVSGIRKKGGIPIEYYITNKNHSVWVSKEEALELSLEGKLEIIVPE